MKRGDSQARVEYEIDRNPATGFGNVIYRIREGGKYKISKVKFTGNENVKSRKLRRNIKTKKRGFFSLFTGSGKFDADQFEDDLEKLKDVYMEEGHLDIDIDPSQVQFSYPSKRRMVIEIGVDEGKEYKVGSVNFEGNELYKDDILRLMLRVKPGDRYRPERLDEDLERIEDFYGQFGYMETRVRLTRVPNVTTGNIDIEYEIYESEKYQVESIEIEGNTKTKSTVVIRELALGPGSTFDSVRMDASRMRLENTRYFEDVNVTPQVNQIPGRRDLKITFREGRTGNFSFGAGFSSLEKGTFFVELTQSNFDIFNWRGAFQGDGQKFRLRAQIGSLSSQIVLAFEEPWLFERRLAFGFNLFDTSNSYSRLYEVGQTGFDVYIRKRLIELIEARLSYSLVSYGYSGFSSELDQSQRDIPLTWRWLAAALAGIFDFSIWTCPAQQGRVDQRVIDDHISLFQRIQRMQCNQARITWAATCHPHPAGLEDRPVARIQRRQAAGSRCRMILAVTGHQSRSAGGGFAMVNSLLIKADKDSSA